MYSVSDNYKTYIKKASRSFESKITIGNRTFNNDNVIQIVPSTAQPNDGFSIGNVISQSMEITLKNDGGVYASVGTVNVEIGLKIDNSIEYIPQGIFNIDTVTKTDYTVKITAYDNMYLLETPYTSSVDNPTLAQVMADITSLTGVEFEGTPPNYTVTKLSGYTCREILAYVASICGGNAYINRYGNIVIVIPSEVDCVVTADNFYNTGYTLEDTTYTIGKITCQNKTNTTSAASDDYDSANDNNTISVGEVASDTMELTFINPWVTTSILNDIYNKLNRFSYLGYTMKWQGDLALDPLDIITVTDTKNVTRKALVFANKLTYTGALKGETSAKGETKNSNSFSSNGPATKNIERLSVKMLIAEQAIITKASIQDLNVVSERVENLNAAVATIDTALINYATVTQLDAVKANIADLNASVANIDSALINKANVADLTAANANISNLSATVANISTLVNGNLTSANIQSLVISSDKVTVENGFIKNAMIESLDVNKINAGTLNTNKISVSSSDGGLVIAGATQQFKDKSSNVRLQMGQDATGEFSFILVGKDGKSTLIDADGIHEGAVADKLIKQNMVADQAIGSQQINYSSFVTGFNAATNTNYINASKVAIDLTGQTLDVLFNNMNTTVNGLQTTTSNNSTSISAIQGQISTLISNTTITTDGTTTQLKDAYNSTVNTISGMQTTIGQHTTQINTANSNITSVNSSINSIQANLSSISASLSSTQSTVLSQGTQITTANNNISTLNSNVSNVTSRVSSLELTTSGLTTRVGNTETAISNLSIGGRNLLRNSDWKSDTNKWGAAINVGRDTATLYNGAYTIVSSQSGLTADAWRGIAYDSKSISCIQGEIYTASIYVKTDNINNFDNGAVLEINVFDSNGNRTARINSVLITPTANNIWQRFIATATIPSGCVYVGIYAYVTKNGKLWFALPKLERGNQATDWTPAPEDVDSSIAAVKDYATQTINSNVSAINQTTDSIKASVQSLQSSVNTINTTLGNKADSSTVTSVTNRVSTLETGVNGINASITTLNSNVSSVTNSFNNLQIGGRNLLIGMGSSVYTITGDGDGTYEKIVETNYYANLEAGKTYTFSCKTNGTWGSVTGADTVEAFLLKDKAYDKIYSMGTNPTTFTCDTTGTYYLRFDINKNNVTHTFWNVKIENGNIATDWTPAPEDVEQEITTTNSNVTSLQSSVSVLQNQIALKVEQSNIDSAITTVNNQITAQNTTISSLQSQINLQTNQITSKVEQSTFNSYLSNTNIIQNGDFSYGVTAGSTAAPTHWNFWGGACVYAGQGQSGYNNARTLYITHPTTSWCGMYTDNLNLSPNTQYTISFAFGIENIANTYNAVEFYDSSNNSLGNVTFSYNLSKQDTIQSFTFTTPSSFACSQFASNAQANSSSGGYLTRLGYVKLEKGSVATGWDLTNNIGTVITQSATQIMTGFNNISNYFQVSADGAKFGDFTTGAYTKMSQKGLEHVDSTGATPYFYISYVGSGVGTVPTNSAYADVVISFPSYLVTRLNGKVPDAIASVQQMVPAGTYFNTGGCYVKAITSTSITITVNCDSWTTAGQHQGGVVSFNYLLIG